MLSSRELQTRSQPRTNKRAPVDRNFQARRTQADLAALGRTYRSGLITHGRELNNVPTIDARGDTNTDAHSNAQWMYTRLRMLRDLHIPVTTRQTAAGANTTDANDVNQRVNQIHWFEAQAALCCGIPTPSTDNLAFTTMDQWLTAIEKDTRGLPQDLKVAARA